MRNEEEEVRIKQNQQVIRDYLLDQFKGFDLTRDQSEGSLYHKCTMTSVKEYTQYTFKVSGARLSDKGNTSEHTKRLLAQENVAEQMKDPKNGGEFSWGFGSQVY